MSNTNQTQITSGNIGPATAALVTAARILGQEKEATGCPTFPGLRDTDTARLRELSGYGYNGATARYVIESAMCDAFWSARADKDRAAKKAAK